MTLVEVLRDPTRRTAVIQEGERLIEDEVARKSGLSGMAVKAAFSTVRSVRPGAVRHLLGMLLPAFAPAMDPLVTEARASGLGIEAFFSAQAGRVADTLLGVTDRKAEQADNAVLVKAYRALRGQARSHVMDAAPGLGRLVARQVG